jgi:hypothetical protein
MSYGKEVVGVEFYSGTAFVGTARISIPVESEKDLSCSPEGLLSLDDASRIAVEYRDYRKVLGDLAEYQWKILIS